MADLGNQQIKDTYNGLLKAEDSTQPIPATGTTPIEDGEGNTTALKLGRSGNGAEISGDLDVSNNLEVGGESVFLGQDHVFSASNARVGIRTANPTSAFEINGSIKCLGLNVDSQNLFINENLDYVKFGTYGQGSFFNPNTNENRTPQYTTAFTSNGVIVEESKIIVVKITGSGFNSLNSTPVEILPALPNAFYNIQEIVVMKVGGGNGNWVQVDTGRQDPYALGQLENETNKTGFRQFWSMDINICEFANGRTLYEPTPTNTPNTNNNHINQINRGVFLHSVYPDRNVNTTQTHYLKIRYRELNRARAFENYVDITIGS